MLTFLSIAWMGAKMIEVEVFELRFSRTVNGEQWWRIKPTTKQSRCTQCRFALANWDTSSDSRGGGGGGGAAAVEWGAVALEQGGTGYRQSWGRNDVKGGEGYNEIWNVFKRVKW